MSRVTMVFACAALLVTSLAATGNAQPAANQRASRLAGQIESPFCPGRTLDTCTSPAAAVWRSDIRHWVDDGVPSNQIKARLSERAGRDLRVVPPGNNLDSLVWLGLLPGIFGLGVVARLVQRRVATEENGSDHARTSDQHAPEDGPSPLSDDALEDLLDGELAEYN